MRLVSNKTVFLKLILISIIKNLIIEINVKPPLILKHANYYNLYSIINTIDIHFKAIIEMILNLIRDIKLIDRDNIDYKSRFIREFNRVSEIRPLKLRALFNIDKKIL